MFKKIEISGIKRLDGVEIELSKINVFIGSNGQGKTSVIDAVNFATSGASDDIISTKTGVAKVMLTSDKGSTIRRTKKAGAKNTSSLTVKLDGKTPAPSPQKLLSDSFPIMGIDPTSICTGSKDANAQRKLIYKITEETAALEPEEIESLGAGGMREGETAKAFVGRVYTEAYQKRHDANIVRNKLKAIGSVADEEAQEDIASIKGKLLAMTKSISEAESAIALTRKKDSLMAEIASAETRLSNIDIDEDAPEKIQAEIDAAKKAYDKKAKLQNKFAKNAQGDMEMLADARSELSLSDDKIEKISALRDKGEFGACPVFGDAGVTMLCPVNMDVEEVDTFLEDAKKDRKKLKAKIKKLEKKVSENSNEPLETLDLSAKYAELNAATSQIERKSKEEESIELMRMELEKIEVDTSPITTKELDRMKAESRELAYKIRSAQDKSKVDVKAELEKANKEYEKHDAQCKLADSLKKVLAERASFPDGVEMTQEGLKFRGVSLGSLSEKEKFVVGIRIVKMLYPKNQIICLDGFETFSKDIRGHLFEIMAGDKYQYFVTIVAPKMKKGESPTTYLKENLGALLSSYYVENGQFTKLEV